MGLGGGRAGAGRARRNGSRSAYGAGAREARDEQSLGTGGAGEDEGGGCPAIDSARRQVARGAARTHSPDRRTVRRPPGCPAAGPSGRDVGTWVTRAWGSVGRRAGASRDGARRGGRVEDGRAVRDLVERSVAGKGSVVDPGPGSRREACGRLGSR